MPVAAGIAIILGCVLIFALPRSSAQPRAIESQEHRLALVIGNSSYESAPLPNPANDAHGMAGTLRSFGFKVFDHRNLNVHDMRKAVADFGAQLRKSSVGLFYFSGHGMQVNGKNYLLPIGTPSDMTERYVSVHTLDVDSVLSEMDKAQTTVNIVILDACRNNPLARSFRSPARGLAFMDAPRGTLIAYATNPGNVALDGEPGKYGLYTGELLKAMQEPNLKIEDVLKRTRQSVTRITANRQTPWEASSLTGDFIFRQAGMTSLSPAPQRTAVQEFAGVWRGTVFQPDGPSYPVVVTMSGSDQGTGEIAYPSLDCEGSLAYKRGLGAEIVLAESITRNGGGKCAREGTVRLRRTTEAMEFDRFNTDGRHAGSARLIKTEPK
jgi:hypothetical protein